IHQIVENARKAGLNTLFFQVRGRGDAYYESALEPRAEALAGTPPGFDPLASAIQECRQAGIQLHAWLNAMFVWSEDRPPRPKQHLVNAHPEWLAVDANGRRLAPGTAGGVFLCPSNPEARQHLRAV